MKLNCSVSELPEFASRVSDFSECEPQAELDRCLRVLRWLESLSVAELVQPYAPVVNDDLISVVVPMYNASRWIETCLKGLLAQTHANLEIFCVDDGSEDDTYERVVDQFGRDRRLCVIKLGKNVGPYQIKNWVISLLARGRLVGLQDADDISHPTRLTEQRRWMLKHDYRICGTCTHQFFTPRIKRGVGTGRQVTVDGMLHNLFFHPSLERTAEATNLRETKGTNVSSYCNQLMQTSLFLELGGFEGRTKVAADTDFNLRLLRFHNIGNIPKVLYSRYLHDLSLTQHSSTGWGSPQREQYRLKAHQLQEEISEALQAGDIDRLQDLCTADLFHGDIKIDQVHAGFEGRPVVER